MSLDVPTLMFSGAFVSVLCGGFLSLAWWQYREAAAIWWAAAFLTLGLAVSLLAISFFAHPAFFPVGLILLIASPALVWCGVCRFFGTPIRPFPIAAAFALWLVTLGSMPSVGREWMPTVLHTLLVITLNGAVIWELMRDRNENLRARAPLVMLTALNIAIYLMAIPEALEGGLRGAEPPPLASMFGLVHLETLIYAIGTTVFLAVMMNERREQQHLRDAETDMLTGLANRRAFLPMAERIADRRRKQGEPYTVVVFDLDHFKSVNDRFGHPFGDEVLRTFARIVRETLRPSDIVSRVGGEEFFAVLPGANLTEGCSTAQRVCRAFEAAAFSVDGREVDATVSAGVMATDDPDISWRSSWSGPTPPSIGPSSADGTACSAASRSPPRRATLASFTSPERYPLAGCSKAASISRFPSSLSHSAGPLMCPSVQLFRSRSRVTGKPIASPRLLRLSKISVVRSV